MDQGALAYKVLLVFGLVGLIKAVWGVVSPHSFKKMAQWWTSVLGKINTLAALCCLLLAAGFPETSPEVFPEMLRDVNKVIPDLSPKEFVQLMVDIAI